MKFLTLFVILILYINYSEQYAKFINCRESDAFVNMKKKCEQITCISSNELSSLTCPAYQCQPGKQIGMKEQDDTKEYPNCCGGPICAEG